MSTELHDYISVSDKLKNLGVSIPTALAILPENLATATSVDDLRQQVESDTVRTLLKQHQIHYVELFDEDKQPPYLQQYAFEWFGPTLFISAGMLSQNPSIVSVTLGVITNYLYDIFKGDKDGKVSLNIVYEYKDGSCKSVRYRGPTDGLSEVEKIVNSLESK